MMKIAITGNIGTGKSTVSEIIKSLGYKVFESDKETRLALKNKSVIEQLKKHFRKNIPKLFKSKDIIDRQELGNYVFKHKNELKRLEGIIHPKIWERKNKFIFKNKKEDVVFFDIPLLFEKKKHKNFDYIFYTNVDTEIQKKRVLRRKYMNETKFKSIVKTQKQQSDIDKRYISLEINTSLDKKEIKKKLKLFIEKTLIKKNQAR